MFAKLLKHEFKSNALLLGILSAAVVAAASMNIFVVQQLMDNSAILGATDDVTFITAMMSMLSYLVFSVVGLAVYALAVQMILLYRFYKHKFADEGYLTFTLPVKPSQIYWSSFLNMLIWQLIAGAAIALVVVVVITFGTATENGINTMIFERIWREVTYYLEYRETGELIVSLLLELADLFYKVAMPMISVVLGATIARKHKILLAFGMYYGMTIARAILSFMSSWLVTLLFWDMGNEALSAYINLTSILSAVFTVALPVFGSWLSIYLMKKKLNLP